jgi:formylglycine-generating enzyme
MKVNWTYPAFCFFLLLGPVLANAQSDLGEITTALKPNVVAIRAQFGDSEEKGFGFITAERNGKLYLATAAHVVRGPDMDKTPAKMLVKFQSDLRWFEAEYVTHWEREDLALLEVSKPATVSWQAQCADLSANNPRTVRFVGLWLRNDPSYTDPGLDGNVFENSDLELFFAISTINRGTSGAPLIGANGIVGMVTKAESSTATALKMSQIQKLFSNGGQYPYFGLQPWGTAVIDDPYHMVLIQGGAFTIGCTSEQGSDCYDVESPSHRITLSSFYLSKYEVTQAQWRQVMGSDPPNLGFKGCDQCPVESVSWEEVQQFLQKLNARTGKKYRLPTEAEWEYAARGGNQSRGYKYAGSNNQDEVAWHGGNSDSKTHPVGQKTANELGLYDMSGNVYEWCQDWYGAYTSNSQSNPVGAASGSSRVVRGGSWGNSARYCRVSDRFSNTPASRDDDLGFRLAL